MSAKPDFKKLSSQKRGFTVQDKRLVGAIPTLAITPVADGRAGAYESNQAATWKLTERVFQLLSEKVSLPDGSKPRIVVAPEIVYGARSAAIAQAYYAREGVSANLWLSRSWAYSDELMGACMGVGSTEWQQAAYGLNQTDRPGAVWLKAFCAAMDEKKRPIFSIYNPDLEPEDGPLSPYVAKRLVRFAQAACAVAEMRGKNYLSIGGVSMGIIGSDVRRNTLLHYFGMGTVSVDMAELRGRMDEGFYDKSEVATACAWFKKQFALDFGKGQRPLPPDRLLEECVKMTVIVRDLMVGNKKLAAKNVERAQGHNAIAAGTQGQRAWTDHYPNFDLTESILCSSFDWTGWREPFVVATENDCKNAMGMLAALLLTASPQLFADIRTNWTAESVKKATGVDVSKIVPNGFIDKRNSGAGALDFAASPFAAAAQKAGVDVRDVYRLLHGEPQVQKKMIDACCKGTVYMSAVLEYFLGDGLSSHFHTPGGLPMTAYCYNVLGDELTCSVVEGETVDLPEKAASYVNDHTDASWPETFWVPRGMSSFDYMRRIGPNHDANSYGLIGADMLTLNAMLRIPVDMHNIPAQDIFRPTLWERYGGDDFRTCKALGPLYI
jgi:L-fucose/D-arabinose isomerase